MKCKEEIYSQKLGIRKQCSRNAVKDGWCKQHWIHPLYAIFYEKIEERMDILSDCSCGGMVGMSDWLPEDFTEDDIGEVSLGCMCCDVSTDSLPISSDKDIDALFEAWEEIVRKDNNADGDT